jgi:4-diphosphocytidyl-2-C-methyl-D-erythritol kinase
MAPFTVRSYAKLNLALRIVGKRPDGFHELVTLFERIDLHDDMAFASAPDGKFSIACDDRRVPRDDRNLVWKAAAMLQDGERVIKGARITITKRIPVAAGLAGGSSNAAAALVGLNRLWRLKLPRERLIVYANKLGSDVAFFLHDAPFAVGTGRGEKIRPLACTTKLWHFLVVAKAPLLTKDVYACYAPRRARLTRPDGDVNIMLRSLRKHDPAGVGAGLFNDLEAPILALKPNLGKLKARVAGQGVLGVSFSGSGPSIFAVVGTRKDAERLKKIFSKAYPQSFAVCTK